MSSILPQDEPTGVTALYVGAKTTTRDIPCVCIPETYIFVGVRTDYPYNNNNGMNMIVDTIEVVISQTTSTGYTIYIE